MNRFSKRVALAFLSSLGIVAGTIFLSADSSAQEKAKTKQLSDKDSTAMREDAMQTNKEEAKAIAALQQRIVLLEQSNTRLEQKAQQYQTDITNTHQRDISNLNQKIMMLDQQVRMRRM
ncbi:MAG: hypothetical protein H8F28_02685 [Fibrella sp.]|nr:hypothetical protein [Armatimonadota bacterium]